MKYPFSTAIAILAVVFGIFWACEKPPSPPQLPRLPVDDIGEAVTIYNCIVDVQRETQQTISELCPVSPDAGPYDQLACPALPMLLLQLTEKMNLCRGTD